MVSMSHRLATALAVGVAAVPALTGTALAEGHGPGDGRGRLQAFAGTVSAVAPGAIQVQVTAIGRPGPAALDALRGQTVTVTLSPQTRLVVTDVNGDGASTAADLAVGDEVIVAGADALASPVVAAGVLDRTHQPPPPGDDRRRGDGGGGHGDHPSQARPDGHAGSGAASDLRPGFLNRVWRLKAHVDSAAPGVLSVTVASIDGLPKRFAASGAALAGHAARVLVDDATKVVAGGQVLTGAARAAALQATGDVVIAGRVLAPSQWPADAAGTPIPTVRAKRIVVS
jgi:hypothetical protein